MRTFLLSTTQSIGGLRISPLLPPSHSVQIQVYIEQLEHPNLSIFAATKDKHEIKNSLEA
jgi:hypothetical protein